MNRTCRRQCQLFPKTLWVSPSFLNPDGFLDWQLRVISARPRLNANSSSQEPRP